MCVLLSLIYWAQLFKALLAERAREEVNLLKVLLFYNQIHSKFFVEKMREA